MRATSPDGAFEFRILERSGKILAQVYRHSAHTFDTTGKVDRNPIWEFWGVVLLLTVVWIAGVGAKPSPNIIVVGMQTLIVTRYWIDRLRSVRTDAERGAIKV